MSLPENKYLSSDYIKANPDWDSSDSPWKSEKIIEFLSDIDINLEKVCDVGCGAGHVLSNLRESLNNSELFGFDIAPDAERFWQGHKEKKIIFKTGDFLKINKEHYNLILLLDVIEHLRDPFLFLNEIKRHADYFLFHFPLDLSSISVFRESPLFNVRNKVGHIHYYTKGLAIALIEESGYQIIKWKYTNASINGPSQSFNTKLAALPRKIAYVINKDAGVRLLGGETLLLLAKPV